MTDLREAAQQALAAMQAADVDPHSSDAVYKAIEALRAVLAEPEGGGNLPPPLQKPGDFDHGIGADRFRVVRGAFWWHVLIGDSPTEHGKFRSRASAEKMAADLLREFRNGAFVQHEAALAEPVQEPVAMCRTWHKGSDQHAELLDWTDALEALPDGEHPLFTHPPPPRVARVDGGGDYRCMGAHGAWSEQVQHVRPRHRGQAEGEECAIMEHQGVHHEH